MGCADSKNVAEKMELQSSINQQSNDDHTVENSTHSQVKGHLQIHLKSAYKFKISEDESLQFYALIFVSNDPNNIIKTNIQTYDQSNDKIDWNFFSKLIYKCSDEERAEAQLIVQIQRGQGNMEFYGETAIDLFNLLDKQENINAEFSLLNQDEFMGKISIEIVKPN